MSRAKRVGPTEMARAKRVGPSEDGPNGLLWKKDGLMAYCEEWNGLGLGGSENEGQVSLRALA